MKSKQEIYENTREMVNKQDKENYLAYYKVFLDNSGRHDIPTEEKEEIINQAYSKYEQQSAELYDILDHAYLDFIS